MKQIEKISENKNYTAVNIGCMERLSEYSFIHPKTKQEVIGKVFVKESTKSSGTEISFTTIPPRTALPYFHHHIKDEETYIILKGSGDFQVDDDCFPVTEGSIIRVSPQGIRGLRNTSDEPMLYICIQSKEKSLEEYTTEDGGRDTIEPKWKK